MRLGRLLNCLFWCSREPRIIHRWIHCLGDILCQRCCREVSFPVCGKCGPTHKHSGEKQAAHCQEGPRASLQSWQIHLMSAVCLSVCLCVFLLLAAALCIALVWEQICVFLSYPPSSSCCSTEYMGRSGGGSIPPYRIVYREEQSPLDLQRSSF